MILTAKNPNLTGTSLRDVKATTRAAELHGPFANPQTTESSSSTSLSESNLRRLNGDTLSKQPLPNGLRVFGENNGGWPPSEWYEWYKGYRLRKKEERRKKEMGKMPEAEEWE